MTHYAERASVWGLEIGELEMSVIGHYVGVSGYGFDEIEFEARISSPEPPERIRELARAAANDCYVTNTLKRAAGFTDGYSSTAALVGPLSWLRCLVG